MSVIKKEALNYINEIPDNRLEALIPLLSLLVNDTPVVETDLTDEEKLIIQEGREEYKQGLFIPLQNI